MPLPKKLIAYDPAPEATQNSAELSTSSSGASCPLDTASILERLKSMKLGNSELVEIVQNRKSIVDIKIEFTRIVEE